MNGGGICCVGGGWNAIPVGFIVNGWDGAYCAGGDAVAAAPAAVPGCWGEAGVPLPKRRARTGGRPGVDGCSAEAAAGGGEVAVEIPVNCESWPLSVRARRLASNWAVSAGGAVACDSEEKRFASGKSHSVLLVITYSHPLFPSSSNCVCACMYVFGSTAFSSGLAVQCHRQARLNTRVFHDRWTIELFGAKGKQ